MQSTKTRSAAEASAGLSSGRCTSMKAAMGPRPSVRAAAATLGVTFCSPVSIAPKDTARKRTT